MKKLQQRKSYSRTLTALFLSVALLFSGCTTSGLVSKQKIGTMQTAQMPYSSETHHALASDHLIYVTQSGLVELYFDTQTYSICVRDTNTDTFWSALPMDAKEQAGNLAATLSLTVVQNGTRYVLNSQDHAVAFGAASFKPNETGLDVVYDMALDEKTANSALSDLPAETLYVSVKVQYTLKDGALYVALNPNDMLVSDGVVVESLELLPYFGATTQDSKDNYIFLPDGSGALATMMPAAEGEDTVRTFLPFGADAACADVPDGKPAQVPAFGMKAGEAAFLTLIENGNVISSITAHSKTDDAPYYRVGAQFRMQDVAYTGKAGKQVQYAKNGWNGDIRLCYRFLSHNNASYAGMATACRELLIRNGSLSTRAVPETEYVPFLLEAQMSVPKKRTKGAKILTDFTQLQTLLSLMKAKGINNCFTRCDGALTGSLQQKALNKAGFLRGLGGTSDFESLVQYSSAQKFSLFLTVDICSVDAGHAAKSLSGERMSYETSNPFMQYSGKETFSRTRLATSKVQPFVDAFVNDKDDAILDGYCIADAGRMLYADYYAEESRLNTMSQLMAAASTLSAGHKLMVDTGNMYLLRDADVVSNLPSTTQYPQTERYTAIPFLQMVLHGTVVYAHMPFNRTEDVQTAFLKAIEYGAIPSYCWYCSETGQEELDANYHFEKQINKAAEQYAAANDAFQNLQDARMTAHGQVQDGVFYTEYNNNVLFYVNYNTVPVVVNSITIAPQSFLRVN